MTSQQFHLPFNMNYQLSRSLCINNHTIRSKFKLSNIFILLINRHLLADSSSELSLYMYIFSVRPILSIFLLKNVRYTNSQSNFLLLHLIRFHMIPPHHVLFCFLLLLTCSFWLSLRLHQPSNFLIPLVTLLLFSKQDPIIWANQQHLSISHRLSFKPQALITKMDHSRSPSVLGHMRFHHCAA